ncbi:MAG: hypothetical protein JWO91_12 [Acidobacteriaceae bacterium]|nr:hypothetical protein [Acidobacteriaceae bacterium]
MASGKLVRALAMSVSLLSSTIVFATGLIIVSPASNHSVSSPVRVVAQFPGPTQIDSIIVSVDNIEVRQAESITPLDLSIPMSEGNHLLTVKGVRPDGSEVSSSQWVNVSAPTATASIANPSSSLVYGNIEEKSGWYIYPDQGNPVCSAKPTLVPTPSLDGISGMFYLGPKGQFNNCLWPILLGSSSTATHFTLDTHYRLSSPAYPQGVEFSSNKHVGTQWYKFSVQCSYNKGIFSVWDTAGGRWSPTNIPCKRPALNSWDHLTVNTQITNGKAVFLSLTLNGVQYPINQSFNPSPKASSYSFGVHFQMDGNRAANAYYAWIDELTFTAW